MKIEKVCKNCDTAMEEEISFQKILLQAKTKAKTKTEKDPTCAIFSKSRCFEDIKYDTEIEKVRKSAPSAESLNQQNQQNFYWVISAQQVSIESIMVVFANIWQRIGGDFRRQACAKLQSFCSTTIFYFFYFLISFILSLFKLKIKNFAAHLHMTET